MKINLFKLFGFVLTLVGVSGLLQTPVFAAATDHEVVEYLSYCSQVKRSDIDCLEYWTPIKNADAAHYQEITDRIGVLGGSNAVEYQRASAAKCVTSGKTAEECRAAWVTCTENGISGDKLDKAGDANCNSLVAAGKLDEATAAGGTGTDKSTCQIEKIGWLVCPVAEFMSKMADETYGLVSKLLFVQPLQTTNPDQGVYGAWSIMRNIANVAFVIAFLIIGYSQITGAGASNYSIKRMLPRLVIAAILVNVSYWICVIAVDISNILGSSMNSLFQGLKVDIGATQNPTDGAFSKSPGWVGLTALVLAGGVAIYAALPVLLPALVTALLAVVVVFLTLTLRQALIIILIVVSPLAFVAYLLPNTESMFKKWRKLFQTLLLMYPIIGLLFGASGLASKVILSSDDPGIFVSIMGALVAIIPLAVTPALMKATTGVLGVFAGKATNGVNGASKGLRSRADQASKNIEGRRAIAALSPDAGKFRRNVYGRGVRGAAKREAIASGIESENSRSKTSFVADQVTNDPSFANRVAGGLPLAVANRLPGDVGNASTGALGRVEAAAGAAATNQTRKAIEDVKLSSDINPNEVDKMAAKLAEAVRGNDSITARAMQDMMLQSDPGIQEYRKTMGDLEAAGSIDHDAGVGRELRSNISYNHQGLKKDAADLMAHANLGGTIGGPTGKTKDAASWNLSDSELVGQKRSSFGHAVSNNHVGYEQAQRVLGDATLSKDLKPDQRAALAAIPPPPPTPPPAGP